jgi:N-acetylmuramoyl-L-alanine amidase
MSKSLQRASAIAVAATLITTLVLADGSGAAARETDSPPAKSEPAPLFVAEPLIQQVPESPEAVAPVLESATEAETVNAASLAELVAAQAQPAELPRALDCLAGAVYFEAKSESLAGQLAVGRVVVARSRSGRFPETYCGVVFQPSQFSFVRGRSMPAINRASRQWKNAVAIAQIAHSGTWRSPVEGALFFHATHVSPGWRLTRLGRVENHVFYR